MKPNKTITAAIVFLICLSLAHAESKWQYTTSMPNARYGHDAVVGKDGRIYVMGGQVYDHKLIKKYNNGRFSNLVFDPSKSKWKVLDPVPGWIKHKNEFYYFDLLRNRWVGLERDKYTRPGHYKIYWPKDQEGQIIKLRDDQLRNTDFQRQGDGVNIALAKDGRIFWTGGNGKWGGPGENLVLPYDPVRNKWPGSKKNYVNSTVYTIHLTDIPSMNQRRMDHEAVSLPDSRIFVLGGYHKVLKPGRGSLVLYTGQTEVLDSVECYDPDKNTWEYKRPMFHKRFLFAAVVGRDNKIYVFGGGGWYDDRTKKRAVYNTTEVYNPDTDTWSYRKPLPRPAFSISGAVGADGRIYIMGGSLGQSSSPPLKDVFIYDPVRDTWEKGPSMNLPRSTLAAVSTPDGKIYAIGGTDAGAYSSAKNFLNAFLKQDKKLYTGQVQDTVEVLDTNQ